MLKVRDRLKTAGYSVWMDVDNMSTSRQCAKVQHKQVSFCLFQCDFANLHKSISAGSTLEAMAHAIEKASLVVICMSQKYKESPSCRTGEFRLDAFAGNTVGV